ncbi:MAG: hypothetical protein U0893_06025 [Chloroflexota bacterium]
MGRVSATPGSLASAVLCAAMLVSLIVSPGAFAQANNCGGFGAGQFNFGGNFQGGFQGGFNNFGGGQFQGGFQGFQFAQGFNNFGGGNFQGFQFGQFNGGIQFGSGFQGFPPGGFNFGGGGFQGGFNNFGAGGLNVNLGVQPFGFQFGGNANCPSGVFGLIPDGATATVGQKFQYRLVWVHPTNWQNLEYLDLRLRDGPGVIYSAVRWIQGNDSYAVVNTATGQPVSQGPSRSPGVLDSPTVTVILSESYADNSGPTGQAVGINVTIIPKEPLGNKFLGLEVGAKNDNAAPTPFELAALLNVVGVESIAPTSNDPDTPRKLTEEQRQQRSRTNTASLDDYRTEGEALETNCDAQIPTVTIANRDGTVVLNLLHDAKDACALVKPGDYVEAIGEKQNEQLYDAHQITVRRNGVRVR